MIKAKALSVAGFLNELDHPLKQEILLLREIILSQNDLFMEQIKWNAPSFLYKNQDFLTFNFPPKKDCILLVFHRGAKVKDLPEQNLIRDGFGLLEWKSTDRAIAKFRNEMEINDSRENLEKIIRDWIACF